MNRPATRSFPKQFRFEQPKSPPVVVNFNGGLVTSDAGLNLIAEIDRKLQITSQFAQCFQDYRRPNRIDLVHGNQEQVFFNTYYAGYCYAPLYIFCGKHLLAAKLRPSNVDPAFGALSELERVIKQIRQKWKNVEILVRGDSAYSRDDIMTWCESQPGLDYVFGLAQNSRLIQMTATTQSRAFLPNTA